MTDYMTKPQIFIPSSLPKREKGLPFPLALSYCIIFILISYSRSKYFGE